MFKTGETRRLRIVSVSRQYAVMRNDDEISKTILRIPLLIWTLSVKKLFFLF
jgi:hypothetical protein